MSDPSQNITLTRTEYLEVDRRGSGTTMAFILGGVVVALGVLVYLMFGLDGGGPTAGGDSGGASISVTVGEGGGSGSGEAATE